MTRLSLLFSACLLALIVLFPACKKKKDVPDEGRPVFGTCKPVSPAGRLSYSATTGYTFRTSGGGTIVFDVKEFITISHDNYAGFKLELWGGTYVNGQPITSANHETLNGKHIKDRQGSRRSIVFPDGAKITIVTDGEQGPLVSISIYDGMEVHHINPRCNTIEYSSTNSAFVRALDDAEADGETATFEITATGLQFLNIYREDTPGNRVMGRVLLGELFRTEPNHVNDYYDDPRLAAT